MTLANYQTPATYTPVLEALDNVVAHLDVILRLVQSGACTVDH